jgi:hypothetical protein
MSLDDGSSTSSHRQSVSWFADRAADAGKEVHRLPSTNEEDEDEEPVVVPSLAAIPAIHIDEAASEGVPDLMADIDKTISG